jgi:hypothetical protein
LIELIFKSLLVRGRIPALEWKRSDIIHVESVGYDDKIPIFDRHNERFIAAGFVDIVGESS